MRPRDAEARRPSIVTKKQAFGRIIADRNQPANLPKDAKPRDWEYHATKGWRSYRRADK